MTFSDRAVQTAIITGVLSAFGTFFVALRLWTRFVIVQAAGYEDFVLIASWLCALGVTVATGLQIHFGLGEHADQLEQHQVEGLLLSLYVSITVYCASIGLTKLAILLQYQRVFSTRRFQIWCWAFIAIIVGYTIATVFACLFICTPVKRFWKPATPGTCINEQASWFANAAINIVTDLMIIILPMPVVNRLRLAKKQKWLLMGVFAFGGVVCIISIVRLHSLLVITTSKDPTYDNAPVASFSIVEVYVAIISACLPALRPLLSKWVSGLSTSYAETGTANSGFNGTGDRKRTSVFPAIGLSSLSTRQGAERLDGEEDEDKIRVITRVDVKISDQGSSTRDGRESSTESLFRNAKNTGHVV